MRGWEQFKIWLRLQKNSSNRSIAAASRTIENNITDNIIENNHPRIDPLISNVPVLLEELDIQSPNFFMLWYFSNITKSVTVIEVRSADLAQFENNNLLIERLLRSAI